MFPPSSFARRSISFSRSTRIDRAYENLHRSTNAERLLQTRGGHGAVFCCKRWEFEPHKDILYAWNHERASGSAIEYDTNTQDLNGSTACLLAARNGALDTLRFLLDAAMPRANARMRNKNGLSPLAAAAENGHWEACKLLLEQREEVREDAAGALQRAIRNGRTRCASFWQGPNLPQSMQSIATEIMPFFCCTGGQQPASFARVGGESTL